MSAKPGKKRQKRAGIETVQIAILAALSLLALISNHDIVFVALSLLSMAGLGVSGLIVLHLLKKDNSLSRMLCSFKDPSNCDQVLTSRRSIIAKGINWGDIGLVYFSAISLFLPVASMTNHAGQAVQLLAIPFTLSFLASFLSLFYQWRVVRSWCRMCLMVVGIVWLQEFSLACYFFPVRGLTPNGIQANFSPMPSLLSAAILLAFCLLISSFWITAKPFVVMSIDVQSAKNQLSNWKRNFSFFTILMKENPPIEITLLPQDYVLGNCSANIRITAVISFYCGACKKEYENLLRLLQKYPNDLQVVIRPMHSIVSKKENIFPYLLDRYLQAKGQQEQADVLKVWFETMDPDKCRKRFGVSSTGNDYSSLLEQHKEWAEKNKIKSVPAIFANGYPLPDPYLLKDLELLIPKWRKTFKSVHLSNAF